MEARTRENLTGGETPLSAALLDGPAARWATAVVGLLDKQRTLCGRLEYLSREQSMLVRDGRSDALVGVLADRQRVIDEVVEVNASLATFRSRRETLMAKLGAAERRAVEVKIDEIVASVERIRVQDEADRAVLEQQRKGVADELAGITRGRGAMAAYGGGARRASGDWAGGPERRG